MCGIIGYIGQKQVLPVLIDGLRRLEYRGYDSAGVAVVRNGSIELRRSAGKLARLEEVIATNPLARCAPSAYTQADTRRAVGAHRPRVVCALPTCAPSMAS